MFEPSYKNDKLLAKYLGATPVSNKENRLNGLILSWDSPKFPPLHNKFLSGHEMKFSTDWNWIHAVMDKLDTDEMMINLPTGKGGEESRMIVYSNCVKAVEYLFRTLNKYQ